MRKLKFILAGLMIAMFALSAAACDMSSDTGSVVAKQQRRDVDVRNQTYRKAQDAVPAPKTVNFPLRRALSEMTVRQDQINHPWYVYILGQNGNMIGYYVSKTVPINACDFLSSTQVITNGVGDNTGENNVITSAPSLDGIYYGGSGAASGCDAWFFFDQATNALIQIRGVNFYTSDRPLKVEAQPIKVRSG